MVRLFTVDEANKLLDPLTGILRSAQEALAQMRTTRDQLVDLRIIWGEKILNASCPDHEEYEGYRRRFSELERDVERITDEVRALGCELKDVENGLVDFTASRGEELVYLCWRKGEDRIGWWHRTEEGFAGRQPLDTF